MLKLNMFEGSLVHLNAGFQPTCACFCSFQYLRLRREMDKEYIFLNASFIADLRHAEFVLTLNDSSFCSSFTLCKYHNLP